MPRARDNRLRTRVGDQLSELSSRFNGGKKKKRKRARTAGDRLEATLTQIRGSRGKGGRRKTVRR
jgi:uncharacterized protein YPO0396